MYKVQMKSQCEPRQISFYYVHSLFFTNGPVLRSLTSTVILVVVAAVPHVEAAVVAVARLSAEVEDDVGVAGVELDLAVRVLAVAAFLGRPAAAEVGERGATGKLNISDTLDTSY